MAKTLVIPLNEAVSSNQNYFLHANQLYTCIFAATLGQEASQMTGMGINEG
uniref:Uncharacterized protein n=1 Tax=Rhizophora mucronata TaxID=61149 RepID=A0A2P2LTS8_RHIMU